MKKVHVTEMVPPMVVVNSLNAASVTVNVTDAVSDISLVLSRLQRAEQDIENLKVQVVKTTT